MVFNLTIRSFVLSKRIAEKSIENQKGKKKNDCIFVNITELHKCYFTCLLALKTQAFQETMRYLR